MLKTERNTETMGKRIARAFANWAKRQGIITDFDVVYEHGQHWICAQNGSGWGGTQWSVVDAEGPGTVDGFDFEMVAGPEDE